MPGRLNDKGLTLVEVMIAFLVLLVTSLALMQTALVSIDSNMKNIIRDEAAGVAEMRISDARSLPFNKDTDLLLSDSAAMKHADNSAVQASECPANFVSSFGTTGVFVERSLGNITNFGFCTHNAATALDGNTKRVVTTVGWTWKGVPYLHTSASILRRQS